MPLFRASIPCSTPVWQLRIRSRSRTVVAAESPLASVLVTLDVGDVLFKAVYGPIDDLSDSMQALQGDVGVPSANSTFVDVLQTEPFRFACAGNALDAFP